MKIGQDQTAAISAQAEVARRTLESTFQPLLVPVVDRPPKDSVTPRGHLGVSVITQLTAPPRCWIALDTFGNERFFVVVPVRNVGLGPASFGWSKNATFSPTYEGAVPLRGLPSSPIVAAGDVVDLFFYGDVDDNTQSLVHSPAGTGTLAIVSITYADISRAKQTVTELRLAKAEDSILQVSEVAVGA